jgi:hypothetical protein
MTNRKKTKKKQECCKTKKNRAIMNNGEIKNENCWKKKRTGGYERKKNRQIMAK